MLSWYAKASKALNQVANCAIPLITRLLLATLIGYKTPTVINENMIYDIQRLRIFDYKITV